MKHALETICLGSEVRKPHLIARRCHLLCALYRTDSSLDAPAAGDAAATPPPETSANVDTDTQAIAPATQVARGAPEQGKQADSQTQAAEDTDGSTDNRTAAPGKDTCPARLVWA